VDDVVKQALINIGLNNVDEIITKLEKVRKEKPKRPVPFNPQAPANSPPGQTPEPPPEQETAEVRAVKALTEIRKGLEHAV
jgi:hypothetical protein